MQVYPDLDVRNIVEANNKEEISNWCDFGVSFCQHRFTVRPFHCLGERTAVAMCVSACICLSLRHTKTLVAVRCSPTEGLNKNAHIARRDDVRPPRVPCRPSTARVHEPCSRAVNTGADETMSLEMMSPARHSQIHRAK